jgi:hypothetical protein
MVKVTATPTWQLVRPSRAATGRTASRVNAIPITIRQTLLPRSLDLSFEFKYRR